MVWAKITIFEKISEFSYKKSIISGIYLLTVNCIPFLIKYCKADWVGKNFKMWNFGNFKQEHPEHTKFFDIL